MRRLEESLLPIEASALADVPRAYVIDADDKSHWLRVRQTIETLAALRLACAKIEPHLYLAPRTLPQTARRLIHRLRAGPTLNRALKR